MPVDTPATRLQWARKKHGKYTSPTEAARSFGWTVSTYLGHENGDRNPSRNAAKRYGRAYGVRWEWLIDGDGEAVGARPLRASIVGHVGAGAEMYFEEGQGPFGEVALPPGAGPGTVAVEIRGDSLGHAFNGWFAYFDDRRDPPTDDLIGHLCVVGLSDGRVLIKNVVKGRVRRRFDLWGAGGEPLQDQRINWGARVTAMLPPATAKAV